LPAEVTGPKNRLARCVGAVPTAVWKVVEDIPFIADANARERRPGAQIGPIQNISRVTMHLDDTNQTLKSRRV